MTIPAMAPPPNPLGPDVGVGVPVVVPVMLGVEVPVRPVNGVTVNGVTVNGVMVAPLVDVESLPSLVSAVAVTVKTVAVVEHSSQVSPPPARTSVAQKAAVESLIVGIVNIAISKKSGGCACTI